MQQSDGPLKFPSSVDLDPKRTANRNRVQETRPNLAAPEPGQTGNRVERGKCPHDEVDAVNGTFAELQSPRSQCVDVQRIAVTGQCDESGVSDLVNDVDVSDRLKLHEVDATASKVGPSVRFGCGHRPDERSWCRPASQTLAD